MIQFADQVIFAGALLQLPCTHASAIAGLTFGGCVYPEGRRDEAEELEAGAFTPTGATTYTAEVSEEITEAFSGETVILEIWADRDPIAWGRIVLLPTGRVFA